MIAETITSDVADDVRERVATFATILREEITPRRITFYLGPKLGVAMKLRLETESAIIRQYCNAPYSFYPDESTYRFTLTCN